MNISKMALGVIALGMILGVGGDAVGQEGGRTFGVCRDSVYLVDYANQKTLYLFDAGVSPSFVQTFGGAADSNRADSFYAIQNPMTDYAGDGDVIEESHLYRINPYTQGVTHIGGTGSLPVDDPIGMREIAYNPNTGELWGVNYNSIDDTEADGFYSINPLTGTATLIGQHSLPNVYGLAYDPNTGYVVGTSHVELPDSDFVRFDTSTGLPSYGTPLPTSNTRITDIWYDSVGSQMRGIGNGPNRLLNINTSTGQAWETSDIVHNIIGLGGQAHTAPFLMSFEGGVNTTATAGIGDDSDMAEGSDFFDSWGGGSEANAFIDIEIEEEPFFLSRETTMMANVEVQAPWDAGWAQINFSAEYYSMGEPPGEGWAEGAFSFEINSESPGMILPGGLPEAGSVAAFGIGGPMMLSIAATEDTREDHEAGVFWDNLDWTIDVSDGTNTYTLERWGEQSAAFEVTTNPVTFTMNFSGDTESTTDPLEEEEGSSLLANLFLDIVLLDPSAVNPIPIDFSGPGSDPFDPIIPPDASNPGDPWVFDPVTIGDGSPGTGTDPIFFDPEIAIGYRYKVEEGDPTMVGVILPDLGDNNYDLWVVGANGELVLLEAGVEGGTQHDLPGVTEFVVLGVDEDLMLDPNDPTLFVTGLIFDGLGTVHLTMLPITTEVIPEPASVLLAAIGLLFCATIRKKRMTRR